MTEEQIAKIIERLEKLEGAVFPKAGTPSFSSAAKPKTIAEVMKGKKFENGQQKVAAIVGYYEKQLGNKEVSEADIKAGWRDSKFVGGYAAMLRIRAEKDGWISDYQKNGKYVLTQSGEDFYQTLTNA